MFKFYSLFLSIALLSYANPDNKNGQSGEMEDQIDSIEQMNKSSYTYLALGDSYTIGESVSESERWPVLLADTLRKASINIDKPRIIARTGWTTDELQKAINEADIQEKYDLVSLLIGVNNQYRGYNIEQYKAEFETLLKQAIQFAKGNTSHVFVVSIPDYGVTPFGQSGDSDKIAREIDEYNQIAEDFTVKHNVRFFNITEISREAEKNTNLIAGDGLHPSGEMYKKWVDMVYSWAFRVLSE